MSVIVALDDPGRPEIIRLLEARDALFQSLYPPESNHYLDVEALRQPQMRFFSAAIGDDVLGCGGIWLHGDYAEVKSLYVAPQGRGRGLGKKIMIKLEEEAIQAGMDIARLETGVLQTEALGLYHALGYAICGPFGDYPTDDPNSIFMEKQLTAV